MKKTIPKVVDIALCSQFLLCPWMFHPNFQKVGITGVTVVNDTWSGIQLQVSGEVGSSHRCNGRIMHPWRYSFCV